MQLLILLTKRLLVTGFVFRIMLLALFLPVFLACNQKKKNLSYPSLPGYDLTNPIMIHLKTSLDEISGIAYYGKDNSIFAIDDEEGILYKVFIRKDVQIKKWKFSDEADYEDLVLHDSTFYALQSNGKIKSFTFFTKDSLRIEDYNLAINGTNDFETLYYDSHLHKIILLCKECETDTKASTSAYAFDPVTHVFDNNPFFSVNGEDVGEELGIEDIRFKPSAAAVHPLTNDVYIISSENKALVIANHYGKVKDVYELDPRLFKQPEGITFTPAGDLLISNESADVGAPNILIFKYKGPLHEKS
jgi:uncharacterized protein YjiK